MTKNRSVTVNSFIDFKKMFNMEFEPFKKIDNNVRKILITNDDINYSTSVIEHISLKDFLNSKDF